MYNSKTAIMPSMQKVNSPASEQLSLTLPQLISGIRTRLIGTDISGNEELLKTLPFRKKMDLAFIYFIEKKESANTRKTMLISSAMMEKWGINGTQLHNLAMANTARISPALFVPLDSFMEEKGMFDDETGLYLLSNKEMFLGAVTMFYQGKLKEISARLDGDFYILPSSVHECLILPDNGSSSAADLAEIVKNVNDSLLEPNEILSYSVYHYSRKRDALELACKGMG